MKTKILLLVLLFAAQATFSQATKKIERVEPPFWWVGMQESKLQLLVYGKNISDYKLNLHHQGVKLESVQQVENPNYLFVNLIIDKSASTGILKLNFETKTDSFSYNYELKVRQKRENAQEGLDESDVVYLIMPDRFANGDTKNDSQPELKEKVNRNDPYGRHGGDLAGLTQNLNYIQELGATAIWMTPFQENAMGTTTFHGYAMTDMFRVDSRFGSNQEYKNYVEEAHKKGIKVVIDIIFNQIGLHHWWMKDLPMKNWINQFDEYTNRLI